MSGTPKEFHFRNVFSAVELVWQSGRLWFVAGAALIVLQAVLPLLGLYLVKLIIDAVVKAASHAGGAAAVRSVFFLIGWAGVVGLAGIICRFAAVLVQEVQSETVSDIVQDMVHAKSIEVDLEFYENPGFYDELHLAQKQALSRPVSIVDGIIQALQNGISLAGVLMLLSSFHWGISFLLVAAVIPAVAARVRFSDRLYQWQKGRMKVERRSWYYNWLLTGGEFAREIRLFDLGGLFRERYRALRRRLRREKFGLVVRKSMAESGAQVFGVIVLFALLGFLSWKAMLGAMTLGTLVMVFQAVQRGKDFLEQTLLGLSRVYEDSLFVHGFKAFLQLESRIGVKGKERDVPDLATAEIEFFHVSFKYPGSNRMVLDDVSLVIRPGVNTALVGGNGAGKSTLVKLLCRLYDPDSGVIKADGIPLTAFSPARWRRSLTGAFQDFIKYNESAGENIWFGDISAAPDSMRIRECAEVTGAAGVIGNLSGGYNTLLGKLFEESDELSMGEWQKIALARAIMRPSQLIILDEPASALDAYAEDALFRKFGELSSGKTALLISHRLSAVRASDHILVLDAGRLAETGTHDELMAKKGIYAGMFKMQAEKYV